MSEKGLKRVKPNQKPMTYIELVLLLFKKKNFLILYLKYVYVYM